MHEGPITLEKTIIWLNGPFGVGKTTVAKRLEKIRPDATRFDPEQIGFMLRRMVPKSQWPSNFQDLALWRELTVSSIIGIRQLSDGPLIVPMNLVEPAYVDEIIGGLRMAGHDIRHFTLLASPDVIRKRLSRRLARPGGRRWTIQQNERCQLAMKSATYAHQIETENSPPEDIAARIASMLADKNSEH